MDSVTQLMDLRIWRDDRMGQLWRVAYNEGHGETVVSFPDTAALSDFIAERLGLELLDDKKELPSECQTHILSSTDIESHLVA